MFLIHQFLAIFFEILFEIEVHGDHDWIADPLDLVQTKLFLNLWVSSNKTVEKNMQDIKTTFQF